MVKNPIPESLSKRRALQIIRQAAQNSANVAFSFHSEDQMEERDITKTQVLKVLRTGTLFNAPKDNPLYDNWECGVKGLSAGQNIGVIIGIERDKKGIIIITVYIIG